MATLDLKENPFRVFTPEDMEAPDVAELFVNPFTDFNKIDGPGHVMLNGPRGCGKSMIFRYLLPDCQCIARKETLAGLPFLAFLISIKNTGPTPSLTEFRRLEDRHASIVLNEHVLTIFVTAKIFSALAKMGLPEDDAAGVEVGKYFSDVFEKRMTTCGGAAPKIEADLSPAGAFSIIANACDSIYDDVVQYAKRFEQSNYRGPLCGYLDFLLPLLHGLKQLSFLPSVPYYLLVDDADYLNLAQTMVLNSWISTRTQMDVSIKISTQLRYKTRTTISRLPIQSPHDFQEINVSDIYTTRYGRYMKRIEKIVDKRLKKAGIEASAQEFFPPDESQEEAIRRIGLRLRDEWTTTGRGHRASDDVVRYARPEFIRSLGGTAKSMSTYSYSGFEQLVHISSGLVRYFLESAARMYDDQRSHATDEPVTSILPGVQNTVCRTAADELMLSEFETLRGEGETERLLEESMTPSLGDVSSEMKRLERLIMALGGVFYCKLVSDDAERRVFSVAVSGRIEPGIASVFNLGVIHGYFHRSSIGNKDGTGRTRLYVLTRRLAPFFKLDPSSFAGYLWVTNDRLRAAMESPEAFVRRVRNDGVGHYFDESQLDLFEDEEADHDEMAP